MLALWQFTFQSFTRRIRNLRFNSSMHTIFLIISKSVQDRLSLNRNSFSKKEAIYFNNIDLFIHVGIMIFSYDAPT